MSRPEIGRQSEAILFDTEVADLMQHVVIQAKRLRFERDHDALTGLLNKAAWREKIEEKVQQDRSFGVIFADIDDFKRVNDTHGHLVGDRIIEERARQLSTLFRRRSDILEHHAGRFGGDEFGIIFDLDDGGGKRSKAAIKRFNYNITRAKLMLGVPLEISTDKGYVTDGGMSIGGAFWTPDSGLSANYLLELADRQMYGDKANRKNQTER